MNKSATKTLSAILFGMCIWPCHAQETPTLAPHDLMSVREQLTKCWTVPKGAKEGLTVRIVIKLKPDGTLDGKPEVLSEGKDGLPQNLLQSAVKAVLTCQPFKLPVSTYESWKELDITFAPVEPSFPEWKSVSLKCPAGNEPLEYIRQSDWGKLRLLVWYKGNRAIKTSTTVASATGGNFGHEVKIDLLRPRDEEQRKRGNGQVEKAAEQMKLGCLGELSDRKKYFEQLKANAAQFRSQRQEVQSGR